MRFCPKCGTRLKVREREGEKARLVCERCGYSTAGEALKGEALRTREERSIKVLDEGADIEPLPMIKVDCPKCGHDTAVWWMLQTRGGDEPTTQFYRCVKCNHTWRHYA